MKQMTVVSALVAGLISASAVWAEPSLHTGGDVYQAPSNGSSEINYAEHYGKLFDQLDADHDGVLQVAELNAARVNTQARLSTGGYHGNQLGVNYSNRAINKAEFIALQNVKTVHKPKRMVQKLNPQQWLSKQIG